MIHDLKIQRASAVLAAACLSSAAFAQYPVGQPVTAPQPAVAESFVRLSAEQLDQLVGAIALYPDPLIAQVLPASTYPIDIVKAARFLRSGAPQDQIDVQDWDLSVKAIARYPSVIDLLDNNLDWTQQLGQAFIAQPDEVMQAIQRQRSKAQSIGNLVTTPQQQVLVETEVIRIVPANPEIIYIPVYEPAVVYYQPAPLYSSWISFGFGYSCGTWFDLDIDWHNHWCYRPGWTWNHWNDRYYADRDHFMRPHHDFQPRGHERPPTVWHRDSNRPLTFPGRPLTRPSDFDRFRGRDDNTPHRPTLAPTPRPTTIDRGRSPEPRQSPGGMGPNRAGDNTRRSLERGQASRSGSDFPRVAPTPSPRPTPSPAPPRSPNPSPPRQAGPTPAPAPSPAPPRAVRPTPSPSPAPTPSPAPRREVRPMPSPAPAPMPRPSAPPPARIAPAPVKIAPPPAAATRPSPPAYVQPTRKDNSSPSRGGKH